MPFDYEDYKLQITEDVQGCLENMEVQPILFVGSGISKRYFDAPNWRELLQYLADSCPELNKPFLYYEQKYPGFIEIGSEFAQAYREWAWSTESERFPEELFGNDIAPDAYIKFHVSVYFETLVSTFQGFTEGDVRSREIELLKRINPHSIITTNYDRFLETVFADYTPVIGQEILTGNTFSVGEVLKIHGCSSQPNSLVFTRHDYDDFHRKKKYLSAKLLTYFAEHPIVFLGYRAEDPNIKSILSDIDEILSPHGELIPNIFIVEWASQPITARPIPEKVLDVGEGKSVRIKSIQATDFDWVFEAFSSTAPIQHVNPKLLRALLARTYRLVRHDVPKRTVEVDFDTLEQTVQSDEGLAKLYGITTLDDPAAVNAHFPHSLTGVGKMLGHKGWHQANELLKRVEQETGFAIKASDNKYHVAIKAGQVMVAHKYSDAAVELLKKVAAGEDYNLDV